MKTNTNFNSEELLLIKSALEEETQAYLRLSKASAEEGDELGVQGCNAMAAKHVELTERVMDMLNKL